MRLQSVLDLKAELLFDSRVGGGGRLFSSARAVAMGTAAGMLPLGEAAVGRERGEGIIEFSARVPRAAFGVAPTSRKNDFALAVRVYRGFENDATSTDELLEEERPLR